MKHITSGGSQTKFPLSRRSNLPTLLGVMQPKSNDRIMEDRIILLSRTDDFFSKHWNVDVQPPVWSKPSEWVGSVPNFNLGGVYALFKGDELIYIGSGVSRGGGSYPDSGLSRRLMAHVYRSAPKESKKDAIPREKWEKAGLTSISTIGFPAEYNYMASSLEDFLIGVINPPFNNVKRKNA